MSYDVSAQNNSMAEIQQAAQEAAAMEHKMHAEESSKVQLIQQAQGQEKVSKDSQNAKPSGSDDSLKSHEGGLALDSALELDGSGMGAAAKIIKTGYDIVTDMDPGAMGGMATMENFTSKGKSAIETGHSPDLPFRAAASGMFAKDPGKTSSWSNVNQPTTQLTNELKMTGITKARDAEMAARAQHAMKIKGGELHSALQMGSRGRVAQLNKEMHIKPPTKDIMNEPVEKSDDSVWGSA